MSNFREEHFDRFLKDILEDLGNEHKIYKLDGSEDMSATCKPVGSLPKPLHSSSPILPYTKLRPIPPPKPRLSENITITEHEDPISFFFPKCDWCGKRKFRYKFQLRCELYLCKCCGNKYEIKNMEDYRRVRDIKERVREDVKKQFNSEKVTNDEVLS